MPPHATSWSPCTLSWPAASHRPARSPPCPAPRASSASPASAPADPYIIRGDLAFGVDAKRMIAPGWGLEGDVGVGAAGGGGFGDGAGDGAAGVGGLDDIVDDAEVAGAVQAAGNFFVFGGEL